MLIPNLLFTEGWAAGCWFVPIVSFFRPYQIMIELYDKTIEYLEKNNLKSRKYFDTSFIGTWWLFWIIVNVLGRVIIQYVYSAETIDKLIEYTIVTMIQCLLYIPLSILTIKVIKEYSNFENILFNENQINNQKMEII